MGVSQKDSRYRCTVFSVDNLSASSARSQRTLRFKVLDFLNLKTVRTQRNSAEIAE